MPAPYNYELRQKAIASVERGEKKTIICRILNISRNTPLFMVKKEKGNGRFCGNQQQIRGQKTKN